MLADIAAQVDQDRRLNPPGKWDQTDQHGNLRHHGHTQRMPDAVEEAFIRARDRPALADLITKPDVERRLLVRLRNKASLYAQDFASDGAPRPLDPAGGAHGKIDVDGVVELYESYIIPLTKEVEVPVPLSSSPTSLPLLTPRQVDYLLQRLDGLSPEEIQKLSER